MLNGRRTDPLHELAEKIGTKQAVIAPGDVSKRLDADAVIAVALDKFKRIDVLVNNAGVVNPGTADMLSDEDFEAMLAINVGGLRNMSLAALPFLRQSRGNIVNVSSVSGMRGDWAMYGYNASKGAVSLLTQGMALDLGRDGVRVNAVAPATTNTPFAAGLKEMPRAMEALSRRIPMGRLVEPEEVASAIAFLAGRMPPSSPGSSCRSMAG
ncbi:MAG: SDR family NAD(P)-dependent oxidoreductase [Paracoccus sp. (in: a-proteobacteria)]